MKLVKSSVLTEFPGSRAPTGGTPPPEWAGMTEYGADEAHPTVKAG